MNTTETTTTLGADCDALLKLCLNPHAHHDEIGRAQLAVIARQEELKDSAEYWLLRAIAFELHRPSSARRFVPRFLGHAYRCSDIRTFEWVYAQRRVDILKRRVERSRASINDALRHAYSIRLEHAEAALKETPHPIDNGN